MRQTFSIKPLILALGIIVSACSGDKTDSNQETSVQPEFASVESVADFQTLMLDQLASLDAAQRVSFQNEIELGIFLFNKELMSGFENQKGFDDQLTVAEFTTSEDLFRAYALPALKNRTVKELRLGALSWMRSGLRAEQSDLGGKIAEYQRQISGIETLMRLLLTTDASVTMVPEADDFILTIALPSSASEILDVSGLAGVAVQLEKNGQSRFVYIPKDKTSLTTSGTDIKLAFDETAFSTVADSKPLSQADQLFWKGATIKAASTRWTQTKGDFVDLTSPFLDGQATVVRLSIAAEGIRNDYLQALEADRDAAKADLARLQATIDELEG